MIAGSLWTGGVVWTGGEDLTCKSCQMKQSGKKLLSFTKKNYVNLHQYWNNTITSTKFKIPKSLTNIWRERSWCGAGKWRCPDATTIRFVPNPSILLSFNRLTDRNDCFWLNNHDMKQQKRINSCTRVVVLWSKMKSMYRTTINGSSLMSNNLKTRRMMKKIYTIKKHNLDKWLK